MLGDSDGGFAEIEAARAEAERAGYVGLVLAARLAKLDAATAMAAPEATVQQKALVADARARGFQRIVQQAETVSQR